MKRLKAIGIAAAIVVLITNTGFAEDNEIKFTGRGTPNVRSLGGGNVAVSFEPSSPEGGANRFFYLLHQAGESYREAQRRRLQDRRDSQRNWTL